MRAAGAAVGVMLPNSAGVAVTFLALQTIGRVPAMINFSSGAASIRAACRAAKVSVDPHLARVRGEGAAGRAWSARSAETVHIVYLEDIRGRIGLLDKVAGLIAGGRQRVARKPDDPAVILFTSGSEGVPKASCCRIANILANVAQCLARVDANGEDLVFNVLPRLPLLRPDGRPDAAAASAASRCSSIPRRCTTASCRS